MSNPTQTVSADFGSTAEEVLPRRHLGALLVAAIIVAVLLLVAVQVADSPNLHWQVVGEFLFSPEILQGIVVTVELTIVATLVGIIGGTVVAFMRLSPSIALRTLANTFIGAFRSVPLLVQLLLWFNLGLVFPTISVSLPLVGELFSWETNKLITPFLAAILGLGLHEAAYTAEIIRAGLQAIPKGQTDAAQMIGLTPVQVSRYVVLPQAIRVIIPPLGNQFIGMLKTTSLVSVIAGAELLTRAENIYAQSFEVIPMLIVVSIWYAVLTIVASLLQMRLEKALNRSRTGTATSTNVSAINQEAS